MSPVWKLPSIFGVLELFDFCKGHFWHQRCHRCQSTLCDAHVLQHFSIFQHAGFCLCLSEGDMSRPVIHSVLLREVKIHFSKWHIVLLSVSGSGKACTALLPQWSSSCSIRCHSLPAFLLFWSGKHMRDSNLHFNYIAQVIRCYLALVIECALRQPCATAKHPLESHSLCVCMCVSSSYLCLSLRVCVCICVKESWRNSRPTERQTLGTSSISNTCICQ